MSFHINLLISKLRGFQMHFFTDWFQFVPVAHGMIVHILTPSHTIYLFVAPEYEKYRLLASKFVFVHGSLSGWHEYLAATTDNKTQFILISKTSNTISCIRLSQRVSACAQHRCTLEADNHILLHTRNRLEPRLKKRCHMHAWLFNLPQCNWIEFTYLLIYFRSRWFPLVWKLSSLTTAAIATQLYLKSSTDLQFNLDIDIR